LIEFPIVDSVPVLNVQVL